VRTRNGKGLQKMKNRSIPVMIGASNRPYFLAFAEREFKAAAH
jgi:hypothetical protein